VASVADPNRREAAPPVFVRDGLPPMHRTVALVAETLAKYQTPRRWRRRRSPMDFIPISREVVATLFLLPDGRRLVKEVLESGARAGGDDA
jgi:hypothetical protein